MVLIPGCLLDALGASSNNTHAPAPLQTNWITISGNEAQANRLFHSNPRFSNTQPRLAVTILRGMIHYRGDSSKHFSLTSKSRLLRKQYYWATWMVTRCRAEWLEDTKLIITAWRTFPATWVGVKILGTIPAFLIWQFLPVWHSTAWSSTMS